MRLPRFEYLEPQSLEEASSMLAAHKGEAQPLSGGTDLLVSMKQRIATPQYVVNLKSIPRLSYVECDAKDGLRIGPLTTLRSVASSPILREQYPILAAAAGRVASPLLRNSATIGGNVALDSKCWYHNQSAHWRKSRTACLKEGGEDCYVVKGGKRCFSVFCSDTVPALMVLGAEVGIISARGKRNLTLDQFCTGVGETPNALQAGELISEIRVPNPPAGLGTAFEKLAIRGSIDYALVDVAVALRRDSSSGRCAEARIAISAVGPGPVLATKAAKLLVGQGITEEVAEAAGKAAVEEVRHISSVWTSISYRRKAIKALVSKAALEAWGRA